MKKRMLDALNKYSNMNINSLKKQEAAAEANRLLVQIQFFQHERLVHLIVTVLFAILAVVSLIANLFVAQPALIALSFLLLVLLAPYIKHYYLLENGVQTLYEYYNLLIEKSQF